MKGFGFNISALGFGCRLDVPSAWDGERLRVPGRERERESERERARERARERGLRGQGVVAQIQCGGLNNWPCYFLL